MKPLQSPHSSEFQHPDAGLGDIPEAIRILHVEDNSDDALFVERHLMTSGLRVHVHRVESSKEFRRLLANDKWDIIFADCQLPSFRATEALEIRAELGCDTPVILITGSINEEAAVEYMISGVEDIIMKDRASRLAPAVRRTLLATHRKREKERADQEIICNQRKIQAQLDQLNALRLIDTSIKGSFDLRITLEVILDQIIRILGVSAASILLADPETRILTCEGTRGLPRSVDQSCRLRPFGHAAALHHEIKLFEMDLNAPIVKDHPILRECLFRAYFSFPLQSKGETLGLLEVFHHDPVPEKEDWLDFLETLVGQAAIAISDARMFEKLQRTNQELSAAYDQNIEGWARALDLRDKETEGHSRRVTEMTISLALKWGISGRELTMIRWGALLHDIGKMGIPDHILLKPGPLTPDEWEIMKRHPAYARDLLRPIHFLRDAIDIPFCHHEKWDGTGYPQGLQGDQIPLAARLFAIVDVWDALSSDRPYRPKWSEAAIRKRLNDLSGSHFDPSVVQSFLRDRAHASEA